MKKTIKGIITNPIILGIVVGVIWSLLKIPTPVIVHKTVSLLAVLATPMAYGYWEQHLSFKDLVKI